MKKIIDILENATNNKEIYAHINQALDIQYKRKDIESSRDDKLKAMISHAYNSTDFYREKYASVGFDLDNFQFEDLARLPLLTKEDIKNNFFSIMSKGYDLRRTMRNRTSGSTGKPVINLQDIAIHREVFEVNFFREREAWGYEGLCNVLMIVPKHFRVKDGVYPDNYFNNINLDKIWQIHPEEDEYDYKALFSDIKPDILYGNPHLL